MQIIQGIRDKGAAITIAAIALALIAFILMDAKPNNNNGPSSSSIGKVNGVSIDQVDFNNRVKQQENQEEQRSGRKVSGGRAAQIREELWNRMVAEIVFYAEADKLGIDFTAKELSVLLSSDDPTNPFLQDQEMIDPATGKLDLNKVSQALGNIKKMKGEQREDINAKVVDPSKLGSIVSKYTALLNASAYYPAWMEEKDNNEKKSFANISYVSIPYNAISDSAIKITDADIEKQIEKQKDLYKQEAGRMISYVSFSQLPTADDSARIREAVTAMKNNFAADSNSRSFLARNSSVIPLNEDYVWKSKMQGIYKDSIMLLPNGGVLGTYIEGRNYVVAKKVDTKQQADSVRCRHILIKIADLKNGQIAKQIRQDSTARRLIDSISAAIKGGADFNEMVLKYSDDQGSKGTKGEYSFNYNNTLVDSFYRTIFYYPVGTKKVVLGVDNNSYYGYHYIEVLNQFKLEPAYKIAYMAKEIIASEVTINNASLAATKLATESDAKKFDTAYLKTKGLKKISIPTLIKENDAQVGQLQDGDTRKLVRWAFEAKKGDISEPYNIGDEFVVASVDKIFKEGTQDAQTARATAEAAIRNEKKGEEIIKKLGNAPSLETAATAYAKQVLTAGADSSIIFSAAIVNEIGQESKVFGACFNKENQSKVSAPIMGKSGVFLVKVNSIGTKSPDTPDQANQNRNQKLVELRSQVTGNWYESLRKQATIKDNRNKFY